MKIFLINLLSLFRSLLLVIYKFLTCNISYFKKIFFTFLFNHQVKKLKPKKQKNIDFTNAPDLLFMDAMMAMGDFIIFLQIIKNLEEQGKLENKIIVFSIKYKEVVESVLPNLEKKIIYLNNNYYTHWEVSKLFWKLEGLKKFKNCIKDTIKSFPKNMIFNNVYYFCKYFDFSLLATLSVINYQKIYAMPGYESNNYLYKTNQICENHPEFFGFCFLSKKNRNWLNKLPFCSFDWEEKNYHILNIASSVFKVSMELKNLSIYFSESNSKDSILINLSSSSEIKNLTENFLINFIEEIREINKNIKIIVIFKTTERFIKNIEKEFDNVQIIEKTLNIIDLFLLIKSCKIVFSADTGIAHVANSFGIKTICLCSYNGFYYKKSDFFVKCSYYLCNFLNYNSNNFHLIFTDGIFEVNTPKNNDLFNFRKITFSKNCQEVPLKKLMNTLIKFIDF